MDGLQLSTLACLSLAAKQAEVGQHSTHRSEQCLSQRQCAAAPRHARYTRIVLINTGGLRVCLCR